MCDENQQTNQPSSHQNIRRTGIAYFYFILTTFGGLNG